MLVLGTLPTEDLLSAGFSLSFVFEMVLLCISSLNLMRAESTGLF